MLKTEVKTHLEKDIIPFWQGMKDEVHGGFYGYLGYDLKLEILDDDDYTKKLAPITRTITENIYNRAYIDHSLVNEAENGVVDTTRVWWVQAEAVVGFLNGYQKEPAKQEYLQAASDIWEYIRNYMIDKRPGSEGYSQLDKDRRPGRKPIVEPWKCPYHNGRMCFEVIRRLEDAS